MECNGIEGSEVSFILDSTAFIEATCFFLLAFLVNTANAVDTAMLDVGTLTGKGLKLEGVKLAVIDINQKKPQFKLSATKLMLPKPFHDLSLANIHCNDFTWDHDELHCNQGRASVRSAYWQSPTTNFSFHLSPSAIGCAEQSEAHQSRKMRLGQSCIDVIKALSKSIKQK